MLAQVTEQLRRAWYRSGFYTDVPGVLLLMKFRALREEYYRDLWRSAAAHTGAKYTPWKYGYARIERDGLVTFVRQGLVMLDDHLLLDIMGNKALTLALLDEKGVPTPRARAFGMSALGNAEDFLTRAAGEVVVKPARGSGGGRGVTTRISNRGDLRRACKVAARFDTELVVEEQVVGGSYRLLFLDGRFVDAVRRDPPVVVGNGRHSIRRLIRAENERRLMARPYTALSPLSIDRDCLLTLKAQRLRPGSRISTDQVVRVKGAVNENAAAQNHSVADLIHPETVILGERLVSDLGVRFAGLDLICRDISEPLTRHNGCINEINTTPGIHHHYLVADPQRHVHVAELLLERMFATRSGTMRLADDRRHVDPQDFVSPQAGPSPAYGGIHDSSG